MHVYIFSDCCLKNHEMFICHFVVDFLEILWKFSANQVHPVCHIAATPLNHFHLFLETFESDFKFLNSLKRQRILKIMGIFVKNVFWLLKKNTFTVFTSYMQVQSSEKGDGMWTVREGLKFGKKRVHYRSGSE